MFRRKDRPDAYARDFMIGLADVLVSFGVMLADAGVVTREEIAARMAGAIEQQKKQGGASPARHHAAEVLRQFFAAPVMRDWQRPSDT